MTDKPTAHADIKRVSLLWATPEHADRLARLHAGLFPEGWDAASFERLLVHPGSVAFVAGIGPTLLGGFALAQVAADEAEILTIGVIADWQRSGVGRLLLDGLKRAVVRAGATSLFLEVAADNDAALALYRRAGFVETGRRKGYYSRTGGASVDAVVMRLELPKSS